MPRLMRQTSLEGICGGPRDTRVTACHGGRSRAPTRSLPRRAAPRVPRDPPHGREPRSRFGEIAALDRGAARSCVADADPLGVHPCDARGGADLSFADFGDAATGPIGPRERLSEFAIRRDPSLDSEAHAENENAPGANGRGRYEILEHETGFEPATLTLAKPRKRKK